MQGCRQGGSHGWSLIWRLHREGFTSEFPWLLAEFSSLKFRLGASVPSWQSDRGHPQFLTMWAFPAWQLFSLDMQAQKALKSLLARWKPQFYVAKSRKRQLKTFAVFCWLEASDRPHPHSSREDYTKVWLPEGRLRLLPHWVTVRTANLWNQMHCK